MSGVAILGALLVIALVNVLTGMAPVPITGDAQLAVWLASLLTGLITFVALKREV